MAKVLELLPCKQSLFNADVFKFRLNSRSCVINTQMLILNGNENSVIFENKFITLGFSNKAGVFPL